MLGFFLIVSTANSAGGSENPSGVFPPTFLPTPPPVPPATGGTSSAVSSELTMFVMRRKKIGLRQLPLFPGASYPARPMLRVLPHAGLSHGVHRPRCIPPRSSRHGGPQQRLLWGIKYPALPSRAAEWVSLQQLLPPADAGFGLSLVPLEVAIKGSK